MKTLCSKIIFCYALLIGPASLGANPIVGSQVVIDFEGAPNQLVTNFTYHENNFSLFMPHGNFPSPSTSGVGTEYPNNGSTWYLSNSTLPIYATRSSGGQFTLKQFDATDWWYGFPGRNAFRVKGYRADGTSITSEFFSLPRDQYQTPVFQTYLFDNQWTNLIGVDLLEDEARFGIDNIVLVETVPEPSGAVLCILAFVGSTQFGMIRFRLRKVRQ